MENIELYCDLIKDNCTCLGCGCEKTFDSSGRCLACDRENNILSKILPKLKKELSINKDINIIDNLCLYSISDLNIDFVDKVIEDNNINEKVLLFYQDIIKNISQKENLSNTQIEFLIENINNKKQIKIENEDTYIFNYLISNFFSGNYKDISMTSKLKLTNSLSNFILDSTIKDANISSKVSYNDKNTDSVASFKSNLFNKKRCFINLNMAQVKNLIEDNNYVYLLETINHECTHAINYYSYDTLKEVNTNNMTMVKEELIRYNNEKYYDDNYDVYLDEVIARVNSYVVTKKILNTLGFKIKDSDNYDKKIEKEKLKLDITERKVDGESMGINTAFDKYVKDAFWLNKYPILNIEYKKVDDKIERKSSKEVKEDYNKYKNGELSYSGKTEEIDNLYQSVIERCELLEIFKDNSENKMNDYSKNSCNKL